MIISRTPLRISLGGGGTDLPSFYEKEDGFWISGAIDKFIYVIVKDRFEKPLRVAYSVLEYVEHPSQLEHPIIRAVLTELDLSEHLEIASFADLPARSGLGSSGSFTVGLIHALWKFLNKRTVLSTREIAEEAFHIEHNVLARPVGKQDPYVASYGWVRAYNISREGTIKIDDFISHHIRELEEYLSLFFIESRQSPTAEFLKRIPFTYLEAVKQIGLESFGCIEKRDYVGFCKLVDEHWKLKKHISSRNKQFDKWIQFSKKHGAIGGKIIGAGGGGCLLFCHEPSKKESLTKALCEQGLKHIPFHFCNEGSKVIEI